MSPACALENLRKAHPGGVRALDEMSLTVEPGTLLAVTHPLEGRSTTIAAQVSREVDRGKTPVQSGDSDARTRADHERTRCVATRDAD
jgi:ABC-type multidrug transport system ATPase subunit